MKHLLFYDGTCGFCDRIVAFVANKDKREEFVFAPLGGKTAKEQLKDLPEKYKTADSLIFIEDYEGKRNFYLMGQGAFRILWLLGGLWRLIGWLYILPPFLYNWSYRLVARYRKKFFGEVACIRTFGKRFLP